MSLLLTSFTTWLPQQKSNASDDLLAIIQQENSDNYYYLRQLPVEIKASSQKATAIIESIQPSAIICCGMAESRAKLTIESNARCDRDCLQTTVNLSELIACLTNTYISDNAGQFVCEGLYYQILNYLQINNLTIPCIFVHVPILSDRNQKNIVQDFNCILNFFRQ
jgi:pyroglutamyl-peptidase